MKTGSLARKYQLPPVPRDNHPGISLGDRSIRNGTPFAISDPRILMVRQKAAASEASVSKDLILDILKETGAYDDADFLTIKNAYDLMVEYHGEARLPSGAKKADHSIEIAMTLCEWGCPPATIAAGMMHNIPIEVINKSDINKATAYLVARRTSLKSYLFVPLNKNKLSKTEVKNLLSMCLLQEVNDQVWLIEAADELRGLSYQGEQDEKNLTLASRAYYITASMLSFLDLDEVAIELENASLMKLDPEEHKRVKEIINDANRASRATAYNNLKALVTLISHELNQKGISHRFQLDIKSVARAKKKIDEGDLLTDASRFRIICSGSKEDCAQAQTIIESAMRTLDCQEVTNERKNYIEELSLWGEEYDLGPKRNGYESIHSHYRGPQGEPINVQVRTEPMHLHAEEGAASHGRFKLEALLANTVIDEARQRQKDLQKRNQCYARHEGILYKLVPLDPKRKATFLDMLFAISPNYGLFAPQEIKISRIDPTTGDREVVVLPVKSPIENGDEIIEVAPVKVATRFKERDCHTLLAKTICRLEQEGKLDFEKVFKSCHESEQKGRMILSTSLARWQMSQVDRISSLQERDLERPDDFETFCLFPLEEALPGLEKEETLHIVLGLAKPNEQKRLLGLIMNHVQATTATISYKIFNNPRFADLWLMVNDVPGSFFSALDLLQKYELELTSLSSQALCKGTYLIKFRVGTKEGSIEDTLSNLLLEAKNFYEKTRFPQEGTTARVALTFSLRRFDTRSLSLLATSLKRSSAQVVNCNFPPLFEGKAECSLLIDIPAGSTQRFTDKVSEEWGQKPIGAKVSSMGLVNQLD